LDKNILAALKDIYGNKKGRHPKDVVLFSEAEFN